MADGTEAKRDIDPNTAPGSTEGARSPLNVGKADFGSTLAVLHGAEKARVVPAVFGEDFQVRFERVQDAQPPPGSLRKADVDAVLRDVVAGNGWSKAGQEGWKGIFNSLARDPKGSSEDVSGSLSYVVASLNAAIHKDGLLELDKKTGPDGTERYSVSMATDKGAISTEIGSRPLPAEYKPILDAVKNDKIPDGKLAWDDNARKAWQAAYDHLSKLPGATAVSVAEGLNALGARMNEAMGEDRVGMIAGFDNDSGIWKMTIGKTSADRADGGSGVNPKAAITLGPFVPQKTPPKKPGERI